MGLVEFEHTERLRREAAAERLREIADQLARHNQIEVRRDGLTYRIEVPDEVELEIEVEVGDDGSEIEIELSW